MLQRDARAGAQLQLLKLEVLRNTGQLTDKNLIQNHAIDYTIKTLWKLTGC